MSRAILLISISSALLVSAALAQGPAHDHDMAPEGLPKNFNDPMPLFPKALGRFTRPISSKNAEAQAYFDQGF